jgi:tetratricopeptide (TPR) repeat protein
VRRLLGLVLAAAALPAFAQDATPKQDEVKTEAACYQDKGVDEYVAEIKKLQTEAKRKGRFGATSVCVFSFCTQPTTHPNEAPQGSAIPSAARGGSESSSAAVTYDPVGAAHNVEVGDYYFADKNYRGALLRYREAVEQKPGDAAIHLRIGRAYEKLNESERAYLAYDAAVKLDPAGKGSADARSGVERLAAALKKDGREPEALARDNHPQPPPCLAPPATR